MENLEAHALVTITQKAGLPATEWQISSSEIQQIGPKPVGVGNFAEVWKGTHKGRTVAIKKFMDQDKWMSKVSRLGCKALRDRGGREDCLCVRVYEVCRRDRE